MRRPSHPIASARSFFVDGVDVTELRIEPDPWSWVYRSARS